MRATVADPGDARQQAAEWSAESLRDVRGRAEDVLAYPASAGDSGYWATRAYVVARDVIALTESVGLLLVRVQEAERALRRVADYGCGCAGCSIAREFVRLRVGGDVQEQDLSADSSSSAPDGEENRDGC